MSILNPQKKFCTDRIPLFRDPRIDDEDINFFPCRGEFLFGGISFYNKPVQFNGENINVSIKIYPNIHCLKQMCRMEWMKAPKNIGVFRSKIVNLRNFLEKLIEHGESSYCGFFMIELSQKAMATWIHEAT